MQLQGEQNFLCRYSSIRLYVIAQQIASVAV